MGTTQLKVSGPVTVFAPAKLNVFLAVTGRRADGFHELVSLAVPLDWGDDLVATPGKTGFECDDPSVPADKTNLVVRAAEAYAAATGRIPIVRFSLKKRIPTGAGLGGGSSDAVAALRFLDDLYGEGTNRDALLAETAARVGSDCPLFLPGGPVVMRGRGERIEPLGAQAAARLRGRKVLIFKATFGIPTPWAYGRLAAGAPDTYLPAAEAESRLARWIADPSAPAEALLFNSFESVCFSKFAGLPALGTELRRRHGLSCLMSGSGSACFSLLPENGAPDLLKEAILTIRSSWGPSALAIVARIA